MVVQDGKLKKELQKCADKNKRKLKMVERVDNNSLRYELWKSNPFKTDTCENSNKFLTAVKRAARPQVDGFVDLSKFPARINC